MKISYLLMLSLVSAIVVGQQSNHVTAVSQSSINLTTSFNPDNVKDFTWTLKTKQDNYQIIKIQNGRLAENLNSRYNWSHHGTILVINNLTKSDSGQYTAQITMWNNSMKEEKFNFTVLDPVPTPKIENQVEKIKDQCFVTLNCSAPSNKESFSYTWKYRYGDSEYHTINETVNTIRRPLPPDHQETEFMCIVQNQADQKNVTAHIKYCSVTSNTASIIIGVVMALKVVFVVSFLVWMFKYSKRSSNTSEQDNQKDGAKTEQNNMLEEEENYKNEIEENRDNQKEGQADEDENEMKEHRNQDEHQNEDNVAHHDPEIGNHKMWENDRYENKVKKHKEEDEHWNNSKNKEIQLQDTRKHRPWTLTEEENKVKNHKKEEEHRSKDENREIHLQGTRNHKLLAKVKYENEMKKHKEEDEHWNKSKNKEIPLQDTREWDDRVQKVEVEEQKKEDKENDEGHPFLEETEFG